MSAPESGAAPDEAPRDTPQVVRGSGDAALAAAAERGALTAGLNLSDVPPLPTVADTANLRQGAPLADTLLDVLPLVGVWRGEGEKIDPITGAITPFEQQVTFAHDGRDFLRYELVTWEQNDTFTPMHRELGWWRPQPDGTIELLVAHSEGVMEVFYGKATALTTWTLSTDAVVRTTSATPVTGATRLYGVVDGKLAYVEERATTEHELQPRCSALLERIVG